MFHKQIMSRGVTRGVGYTNIDLGRQTAESLLSADAGVKVHPVRGRLDDIIIAAKLVS